MENAAVAFIEAMGNLGAGYLFAIGIICVLAYVVIKAMPMINDWQLKRIEIEQQREERKAREELSREQRDRERSELEGRWLTQYAHATSVQEQTNSIIQQTNAVVEGVSKQMDALSSALEDSKNRSHEMSLQVAEIHESVVRTK